MAGGSRGQKGREKVYHGGERKRRRRLRLRSHKKVIKNKLMVTKGERGVGRDKLGVWDYHRHTTIYKIDNQQGPTVEHRELYSMFCDGL